MRDDVVPLLHLTIGITSISFSNIRDQKKKINIYAFVSFVNRTIRLLDSDPTTLSNLHYYADVANGNNNCNDIPKGVRVNRPCCKALVSRGVGGLYCNGSHKICIVAPCRSLIKTDGVAARSSAFGAEPGAGRESPDIVICAFELCPVDRFSPSYPQPSVCSSLCSSLTL